ncbi:RNA polymerase sigma factor [Rhizobium sp. YIM 134829]|uniref:RNA polymerase sigma factor n=1 Tax=Rhizobium sp. YIM 134829 TaxID=3390453 RepID=UPI00397A859A
MMATGTGRAVEQAVRQSYGRLLALLARQTRDMAAAEDALADALSAALETWPVSGVPATPEAWLLTTARRRIIDRVRRARVVEAGSVSMLVLTERTQEALATADRIPDHRLELMFACCHPSIEPEIRTPLMLQTVLGIDAASIASAFLVAPSTMGQRLSRAKARIKQAGHAFELPERRQIEARLDAVLSSIYVAFSLGLDASSSGEPAGEAFSDESLYLSRLLVSLMPDEPEVLGLAALELHIHARRHARFVSGRYVPLNEQDPALWDRAMIAEAEACLSRAGKLGRLGRFQLEAAIQSVHAGRAVTGRTDWPTIAQLYEGLVLTSPSIGARIGRALAVSQGKEAARGLALLDEIAEEAIAHHQPYWAARADLLARAGRRGEADDAYGRTIGLSRSPAIRAFLTERRQSAALEHRSTD